MPSASQPSTSSSQTAPQGLFAHSFGDLIHFLSRTIWPESSSADAPCSSEAEDAAPSCKYAPQAGDTCADFIPTMSRSSPPTSVKVRDFAYESVLPPIPSVPRLRQQFQPSRPDKRNKLKRTRANYEDDTLPPDPDVRRTWYTDSNAMRPSSIGSYVLDSSKQLKREDTEPLEQGDVILRLPLRTLLRGGPATSTDRSHGGFTRRLSRSRSQSSNSNLLRTAEVAGPSLAPVCTVPQAPQATLLPAGPRVGAYTRRHVGPSSAPNIFANQAPKGKGKGRLTPRAGRTPERRIAAFARPSPTSYNLRSRIKSQTPSSEEGSQVFRRTRSSSRLAEALHNTSLSRPSARAGPSNEPGSPRKKRRVS